MPSAAKYPSLTPAKNALGPWVSCGFPAIPNTDGRSRRPEILAAARGEAVAPTLDTGIAHLDQTWGQRVDTTAPNVALREGSYQYIQFRAPNGKIAEGFDTLVVTLTSGKFLTGILKKDEGKQLRLVTPEGKVVLIPKDEIEDTQKGKSAMPEDLLKHLSKRDIRDLVEFLATQK